MDDQTESHLPLCKVPDEGEFKQDDLCKAYIEIMRKMSEIPVNAAKNGRFHFREASQGCE